MKFSGAVLIGRVNGSRSGAWGSWMKEALSSSTLILTLTVEEARSPVSSLRIRHVSLGVLDASNLLVTRELMRLISSLICSFILLRCCFWPVLKQRSFLHRRRFRWGDEIFVVEIYIVSRGQHVSKQNW